MREGVKLRKPSIFVINWFSSCLSFFQSRLPCSYIYFHHSYLHNYYNYSRTLCIKCWYLSIPYSDLKKFHYFADTTETGVWGWKEAQRQGEDRDFTDNSILDSSYHLKPVKCKKLLPTQNKIDSKFITLNPLIPWQWNANRPSTQVWHC